MLVIADGIERAGFALQAEDGTILLSTIDEEERNARRLAQGYAVHHPHLGPMKVVPVLVRVQAVRKEVCHATAP
jgi:hypothetical protein